MLRQLGNERAVASLERGWMFMDFQELTAWPLLEVGEGFKSCMKMMGFAC